MYMVAGLGNPGRKYVNTRHNIGFDVLDAFCAKNDIRLKPSKFKADIGLGEVGGERVIAVKPMTFMNLSGEAVAPVAAYYDIPPENIIVISDDKSMALGKLRTRACGSAGGHNGLKSIIMQLGSDNFPRVKLGIGSPEGESHDEICGFVLGRFSKEETEVLTDTAVRAVLAVEEIIKTDVKEAVRLYNG
ncbi:MAG TPA: aminoacyl-tRNA hydrolase [Candidatus Monoglobus merdigallinarum]|uniref:Peptidyl-tRNA hydrolase n=1 Tax=Candidatus Monoglobus merdigallinarum TaxID=2838698 RepID=A0A9D1TMY0_9FIRM|nr:aminoacyl-tRNA hydrolase [Candidatus Monoglobus merdigallinarum]